MYEHYNKVVDYKELLNKAPRFSTISPINEMPTEELTFMNPLETQVGGDHYKKFKIQPIEYIHGNNIPFIEGCIIKYISRWRDKGGVADLNKAKHFIDLLIELEAKQS